MRREIRKYLFDIQEAIDSINDYLGEERDFQVYLDRKVLRRAVERELEIIGEATNRILKLDQKIAITDSRRIVNLRNLVIHGYDQVDNVIIWGLISRDIPLLKKQVDYLLGNVEGHPD